MNPHLVPKATDPLVTREELAEILGVSVSTVDRMKKDGMPSVPLGRRLVRFDVAEVFGWFRDDGRSLLREAA